MADFTPPGVRDEHVIDRELIDRLAAKGYEAAARAGDPRYAWRLHLLGHPQARLFIEHDRTVTLIPPRTVRLGTRLSSLSEDEPPKLPCGPWRLLYVLVLLLGLASSVAADRPAPTFGCAPAAPGWVKCTAFFVDPYVPRWEAWAFGADRHTDVARGAIGYLEAAPGDQVRMCLKRKGLRWCDVAVVEPDGRIRVHQREGYLRAAQ